MSESFGLTSRSVEHTGRVLKISTFFCLLEKQQGEKKRR